MTPSVRAFSDGYLSKIPNPKFFLTGPAFVDTNAGDQINSTIFFGVFFPAFISYFLSLEMTASDIRKHLLFTSHSRTIYQLQDKGMMLLFLKVATKSSSKESNV